MAASLLGFLALASAKRVTCDSISPQSKTVYDYKAMNIYENETIEFTRYRGSVLAIMNVATY